MKRTPEPEVMDGTEQSAAYAQADFAAVNAGFVERLLATMPGLSAGVLVDLGCGPADICMRLAAARPELLIHGVDASDEMLSHGRDAVTANQLEDRVHLHQCYLPLPSAHDLPSADWIMSNSLLHHLAAPETLWQTVKRLGRKGAGIYVMDLARPPSIAAAKSLVDHYAAGEPDVLRHDFYHSLHAAYRVEEVREQLISAELHDVRVEMVSDRHWCATGHL